MQGWYFSGTVLGDFIFIQRWCLSGTCPWGFHTHARMVPFRSLSLGISYPCNDGTSQVPVLGDFKPYKMAPFSYLSLGISYPCKDGTFQAPVLGEFTPKQGWYFLCICPGGSIPMQRWHLPSTCPWGFHTHARMVPFRYQSLGFS